MQTTVGILTFMSRINLKKKKHQKSFITSLPAGLGVTF